MLGQGRRRWANIKTALCEYPVLCWIAKWSRISGQLVYNTIPSKHLESPPRSSVSLGVRNAITAETSNLELLRPAELNLKQLNARFNPSVARHTVLPFFLRKKKWFQIYMIYRRMCLYLKLGACAYK